MNIQLLSDLHFEFYPDLGKRFIDRLDAEGVDVLVLAGDISLTRACPRRAPQGMLRQNLEWLCAKYPHVVFVLGNHEFYRSSVDATLAEVRSISEDIDNLHWLENDVVEIDGQRFVGCTLWFNRHPDGLNNHYGKGLNDFYQIEGFRDWVYERNGTSMTFLRDTVQEGDVVITHHIPTIEGVHPRWLSTQQTFGRFFTCQMPYEVLHKPKFWFYGHTHDSMSFSLEDCEFRCNPFGYEGREHNSEFDPKLVVTV